jgi:hypothetical protein
MVYTCIPDFSGSCGHGYTSGPWASADVFGTPVPLKVRRYRLDPGARARMPPLGGTEAMAYVIAGSGTALPPGAGDESFSLAPRACCGCRPVTASPPTQDATAST